MHCLIFHLALPLALAGAQFFRPLTTVYQPAPSCGALSAPLDLDTKTPGKFALTHSSVDAWCPYRLESNGDVLENSPRDCCPLSFLRNIVGTGYYSPGICPAGNFGCQAETLIVGETRGLCCPRHVRSNPSTTSLIIQQWLCLPYNPGLGHDVEKYM